MRGGTKQGLRGCQAAQPSWRTLRRSYRVPEPFLTLFHLIPTTGGGESYYHSPLTGDEWDQAVALGLHGW